MQKLVHLLNYTVMHPDTKIRFHCSRIILHTHSDGSYLSVDLARSRIAGFFFLANDTQKPEDTKPNGAVYLISIILKNIMASATEMEIVATFDNTKDSIPL